MYGKGDHMDRRQKRTRNAIFAAFTALLQKKNYESVTVQEIIDLADIGRSTFYAHFETKDDLVRALCEELFDHIVKSAMDRTHTHGLHSDEKGPESVYYHMLKHLEENDFNVLTLLSCESGGFFTDYYKEKMKELVKQDLTLKGRGTAVIPEAYLINHISASFVEMLSSG